MKNAISVIIPTYNRLHTLPRAIDSIRNQSYPHWELIVVDDGSTDRTEDWIHHQQKDLISSGKMRYMRIDRGGVSRARNTGIERSRGEWLAFWILMMNGFPKSFQCKSSTLS
ncbi:MAG: glycosyltransferase family 2 protein [Bdellovibrionales bacterium]|nr:glycosyltransferase family 2 protein [Bdellovibrionales bacterium]